MRARSRSNLGKNISWENQRIRSSSSDDSQNRGVADRPGGQDPPRNDHASVISGRPG
jgi:hypothetical protein